MDMAATVVRGMVTTAITVVTGMAAITVTTAGIADGVDGWPLFVLRSYE